MPFVRDGETQSMLKSGLKNVIVLLSISKVFAIPGLRIGFVVAPSDLIAKFKRYLLPWSVNSLAQAAVFFLTAQGSSISNFINDTKEYIEIQRKDFSEAFKSVNSIKLYPSTTPFFLARLPNNISAESACNFLANDKILIRNCSNFPGLSNQFIRISLKTPLANRRLVDKLLELIERSANTNFNSKRKRTAGL
jgi:threonine-phosphate decarboxylase